MQDAAERVRVALQTGELGAGDLNARSLAAWLGKTTSVLYHHWGSLDGFLHAVTQSGMCELARRAGADPDLEHLAMVYLDFALSSPTLYGLMFHHQPDWAALRASAPLSGSPGLLMFRALVARFAALGSSDPDADARVFFAALHGLASLAVSGRMNVDDLGRSDADVARAAARRLVALITPFPRESP